MCKKRLLLLGGLSIGLLYLAGCEDASETANKAVDAMEEAIKVESTKDDPFVVNVKEGTLNSYPDQLIGVAFASFFSKPPWIYFKADTEEDGVEFTGYCMYMEQEVKAKLQFLVDEETGDFEVGALSFNDVPQNELTTNALIEAIYKGEEFTEPDPTLAHNDSYFIEKAHNGYIVELPTDTIGNIFSDSLFSNLYWSVDEDGNVSVNGDYNGEIFPGEPSNLEFKLSEVAEGEYSIINLLYNGETVPVENYSTITDIIYYATAF